MQDRHVLTLDEEAVMDEAAQWLEKAGKIVDIVLILIVNLLIGGCVGLTGIAGFLLPMFYTGFLGMPSVQALALSFAAFLISGVFGSVNYYRSKNLDIRTAMIMSAGSIAGAVAGVRINLLIPEDTMKVILYAVVLISGVSILLRREKADSRKKVQKRNPAVFVLLGFVTGAVCAASGAGWADTGDAAFDATWISGTHICGYVAV